MLMSQGGVLDPFARTEGHQLSIRCENPTTHNVLQIDALQTRSYDDREKRRTRLGNICQC